MCALNYTNDLCYMKYVDVCLPLVHTLVCMYVCVHVCICTYTCMCVHSMHRFLQLTTKQLSHINTVYNVSSKQRWN